MYSKPKRIGIIMDGNRRWALKRGLPVSVGHKKGAYKLVEIVNSSIKHSVEELTVFGFSTENWDRPENEVNSLMHIFEWFLKSYIVEIKQNNINFKIIGCKDRFQPKLKKLFKYAENLTKDNSGMNLNIALNYGGKKDLLHAVTSISKKIISGELIPEKISENDIKNNLYSKNIHELDLLIRTSGEKRLSNFLPWQTAYSEIYFTDSCWPEFSEKELNEAFSFFGKCQRKFGKTFAS